MKKKNLNLPGNSNFINDGVSEKDLRDDAGFRDFAGGYGPMKKKTFMGVLEALLKYPARIVHEIMNGNMRQVNAVTFLILLASMLVYGLIMGTFSGGNQLWAVPLKAAAGALACGLICLPSLYIFTCLSGGSQSFAEVTSILLAALALCGILLMGFAPVAWVFSQATGAIEFMGALHLIIWGVSTFFGLRLLLAGFEMLNKQAPGAMKFWVFIYLIVALQMMTCLRPLIGGYSGFITQEKKFFLTHWFEPHR